VLILQYLLYDFEPKLIHFNKTQEMIFLNHDMKCQELLEHLQDFICRKKYIKRKDFGHFQGHMSMK